MIAAWWLVVALIFWPAWFAAGSMSCRLGHPPAGRHHEGARPGPAVPETTAEWLGFDPDLLPRIDALTPAQQLDALLLLGDRAPAAVGQVLDLVLPKQPAR